LLVSLARIFTKMHSHQDEDAPASARPGTLRFFLLSLFGVCLCAAATHALLRTRLVKFYRENADEAAKVERDQADPTEGAIPLEVYQQSASEAEPASLPPPDLIPSFGESCDLQPSPAARMRTALINFKGRQVNKMRGCCGRTKKLIYNMQSEKPSVPILPH